MQPGITYCLVITCLFHLQWITAGVGASEFHGGNTPSLTDLEVFGVLRALEGMTYVAMYCVCSEL